MADAGRYEAAFVAAGPGAAAATNRLGKAFADGGPTDAAAITAEVTE